MPSVDDRQQRQPGLHLDGGVEHRVPLDVGRQPRHLGPLQLLRRGPGRRLLRRQLPDRRLQHRGARPDRRHDLLGRQRVHRARRRQRHLEDPDHVVLAAPGGEQRLVLDQRRGRQLAVPADVHPVRSRRPVPEHARRSNIELYDTFGNLVAVGTKLADGRNEAIFFNAPVTGQYYIHVFNNPGSSGEYFLSVNTAQYQSGGISGQVYNDLNGNGTRSGRPGPGQLGSRCLRLQRQLRRLPVDRPATATSTSRAWPRAPTRSTRSSRAGWTQTSPAARLPTPSPSPPGATVIRPRLRQLPEHHDQRREVQRPERRRDLRCPATRACQAGPSICSTPAGAIVATTVTDANGDYSFTDVGPGTYTVQEELQPGWIQTFPAPPGTYTVTATSGQDAERPALRQLPARDLRRHGLQRPQRQRRHRPGRPGPAGLDGQPARPHRQHRRHDHQRRGRHLLLRQPRPGHLHDRGGQPGRLVPDPAGQSSGNLHRPGDQQHQPVAASTSATSSS